MTTLDRPHVDAVLALVDALADVPWALTGSTSFALQGVPVDPEDVDVQTTEDGAYAIEDRLSEHVRESVAHSTGEGIRSHFGALELAGVRVEVMGALQRRDADGGWTPPVDPREHRRWVELRGHDVPVLALAYEADAYEGLGRTERADLLRAHADAD